MTAEPLHELLETDSLHLLTIKEYAELGETEHGYTELIEGRLLVSPRPVPDHNYSIQALGMQLWSQLPESIETVPDMDIDLELVPADAPGFSRRPDLLVVPKEARARVRSEGGLIRASEVIIVVDVVSPSSKRIDHVDKRRDYADAGIPNYWIIDIDEPISLTECRLTEEFGYQDNQTVTGTFRTDMPFPFEVNLDRLV